MLGILFPAVYRNYNPTCDITIRVIQMCVLVCFQHIEKVFKHKDLEQQLVDAKLAQANLMMTEEKEKGLKEKQLVGARVLDIYFSLPTSQAMNKYNISIL